MGNPKNILILIECKQPTESAGVAQLETYLSSEPRAKLGIWVNNANPTAPAVFLYRMPNGSFLTKRKIIQDIPRPGDKIDPKAQNLLFADMVAPTEDSLKRAFEDLIDKIVARDSSVTRREEQLDQLCNLFLLKLYSDRIARMNPVASPIFRPLESSQKTAANIKREYEKFVNIYPDVFIEAKDKHIRFDDETVNHIVEDLARLRLLDLGISTVSLGFQVLRTAALKQGEGQFFTPPEVIRAGVKLLQVTLEDLVIDPACGTGGFLVETIIQLEERYPQFRADISRWAQTNIYGIEKDAIGVKLTKAIMQIAGDGSAHCVRGDSVRTHNWARDFKHLLGGSFGDGRFSVVMTNPPFGSNLKISAEESRLSGLDIALTSQAGVYRDLEIGLLFLNRSYQLLRKGGRLGIILPETYFFSNNYSFVFEWIRPRLRPQIVLNVPMEAFQGFCRAKTNFYIFEKIA